MFMNYNRQKLRLYNILLFTKDNYVIIVLFLQLQMSFKKHSWVSIIFIYHDIIWSARMLKFPFVHTTANVYTCNDFIIQNPRNPSNYPSRH